MKQAKKKATAGERKRASGLAFYTEQLSHCIRSIPYRRISDGRCNFCETGSGGHTPDCPMGKAIRRANSARKHLKRLNSHP